MDVQRRPSPDPQQVRRDDLAVGHEHEPIRIEPAQLLARDLGAQASRRQDRDVALSGSDRDRRRPHLQPPAGRPIRLADDQHLVGEVRHAAEQRDSEGAGAQECDPTDPLGAH